MLVKSYRVNLRPQNCRVKVADGQPESQFPGGPPIGTVREFDTKTGIGTVVLDTPVHYSELEELGIGWKDFIDYGVDDKGVWSSRS